jgi:hypothetical protein
MAGLSRLAEALTAESTLVAQLMANAVDSHIVGFGAEIAAAPPHGSPNPRVRCPLRAMSKGDRLGRLRTSFGYEAAAFSDWLGRGGAPRRSVPDAGWRHVRLLCKVTGWTALARAVTRPPCTRRPRRRAAPGSVERGAEAASPPSSPRHSRTHDACRGSGCIHHASDARPEAAHACGARPAGDGSGGRSLSAWPSPEAAS